jgi:hypothetical protein
MSRWFEFDVRIIKRVMVEMPDTKDIGDASVVLQDEFIRDQDASVGTMRRVEAQFVEKAKERSDVVLPL